MVWLMAAAKIVPTGVPTGTNSLTGANLKWEKKKSWGKYVFQHGDKNSVLQIKNKARQR